MVLGGSVSDTSDHRGRDFGKNILYIISPGWDSMTQQGRQHLLSVKSQRRWEQFGTVDQGEAPSSHGLELVDALLCVTLSDLAQCLVFVSSGFDVLCVEHVVLRLLGFVSGLGQLGA